MSYNAYDPDDILDRAKMTEGQSVMYVATTGQEVPGRIVLTMIGARRVRFGPGDERDVMLLPGTFHNRTRVRQ